MKTLVHITQEDIEAAKIFCNRGELLRSRWCPVARAVRRALGRSEEETPNPQTAVGIGLDEGYVGVKFFPLSEEIQTFVSQFDQNKPVQPFSVELDLPV